MHSVLSFFLVCVSIWGSILLILKEIIDICCTWIVWLAGWRDMFPGMKNCCPWALLYNCGKLYGCWITWTWNIRWIYYFTINNMIMLHNDTDLTWGIDVEDIGCIACPIDCWKPAEFPIPVIVMPVIALPAIIWFMCDMLMVDIAAAIFIAFMGDELATFPPFCCCCWPPGDGPGVFGCCCWGLISCCCCCCCCWGLDMICCWNTNWNKIKSSALHLFFFKLKSILSLCQLIGKHVIK